MCASARMEKKEQLVAVLAIKLCNIKRKHNFRYTLIMLLKEKNSYDFINSLSIDFKATESIVVERLFIAIQ